MQMFFLLVMLTFTQKTEDEFKGLKNFSKQFEDFSKDWKSGMNYTFGNLQNSSKTNILVCGGTGVGKSTLINAIFKFLHLEVGIGKSVTKNIKNVTAEGIPLVLYDSPGLEISEKRQKKIIKEIISFIKSKQKTKNENEMIHCIYLCINAESKRFQDGEIDFIRKIVGDRDLQKIPVIIVLTQCIDDEVKEAMIKTILDENLNIKAIVPVLAKEKINIKPYGIEDLLEKTRNLIPEMLQKTLSNIINLSLKYRRIGSHAVVTAGTGLAAGIASGLIPHASLVLTLPVHYGMLYGIKKIYGVYIPLNFLSAYIKWTFGFLEINNETFAEIMKQKDTFDQYNNGYYNTENDSQKKEENINELMAFFSPIIFESQLPGFEQNFAYFAKVLGEMTAEVLYEIKNLVVCIATAKGNLALGAFSIPYTAILGESFMGFVEEIYLKQNFKFSDITIDDIRKYINTTHI